MNSPNGDKFSPEQVAQREVEKLMRLCYQAGKLGAQDSPPRSVDEWWKMYGKDRHDKFVGELGERLRDTLLEITGAETKRAKEES